MSSPPPQPTSLQVAALIRQIADGDESAFAKLYDATASRLYGMALSVLGDAGAAEQVAFNVYVDLWRTARCYDPSVRDAYAWVQHLAVRHMAGHAYGAAHDEHRVAV